MTDSWRCQVRVKYVPNRERSIERKYWLYENIGTVGIHWNACFLESEQVKYDLFSFNSEHDALLFRLRWA